MGPSRVSPDPKGEPYTPLKLKEGNPSSHKVPGISFRNSMRWCSSADLSVNCLIPFISKSGKFSIYTLCRWKTNPARVFATVLSTVYQRLQSLIRKRHKYSVFKKLRKTAFKVSLLYTILHQDNIIDRFLGMTSRKQKTPIKAIYAYVYSLVCSLDGDKRFVYSQAFSQANWFMFLASRPSDKSRNFRNPGIHLRQLSDSWGLDVYDKVVDYSGTVKFLCTRSLFSDDSVCLDPWVADTESFRSETDEGSYGEGDW